MSTDRELLELAAKAAGMTDAEYQYGGDWMETRHGFKEAMFSDALWEEQGSGYWNPLESDGEALRLAVKLNLAVSVAAREAGNVTVFDDFGTQVFEPLGTDPYAATRRAIVRAAAEIGRTL